jgi:3-hydroxybutyryl-CoA dehydratase
MSGPACVSTAFEDLQVGMRATLVHTVTEADITAFAGVSGDINPVHLDETYAARTRFGGRIAHGILTASFISAVIGTRLPGPGTIYVSQSLRFLAPVHIGDTVETSVEIRDLQEKGRRCTLFCECRVNDKPVLDGEAGIIVPSRAQMIPLDNPASAA